jgi:hypothetical protein
MKNEAKIEECPQCGSNNVYDHSEFGLPLGNDRSCGSCKLLWRSNPKTTAVVITTP